MTWGDGYLFRTPPTYAQRSQVAITLLHEMAHMWFGDLVTMRWWDDLWLNEAFASWASTWAAAEATEFTDAWAEFLVGRKLDAYRVDMGPATHADPQRGPRRRGGAGQLRLHHLRQGPGGAAPADGVRRRGGVHPRACRTTSRGTPGATPGSPT